jgi:FMN phosphatase YigB (HAD superfamily)
MRGGQGVSAVGLVRHPHASHVLGLLKPGREIYNAFERETGVPGHEILFFDDLPENVQAAAEAGWNAEQIDFTRDTRVQIERSLRDRAVLPAMAPTPVPYNPRR